MTTPIRGSRLRSRSLVAALFLGPLALVVSTVVWSWITRDGASDDTGAHAIVLATAHLQAYRFANLAAIIGSLLMVPAALATMRVIGDRSVRLGFIGAVLTAGGFIAYFGGNIATTSVFAMATHPGPTATYAKILDASQSDPSILWVSVLFVLGNLAGIILLGLALLRSRVIPRWASVVLLGWPVLHVIGLFAGNEWFEAAGSICQLVGFAAVALALPGPVAVTAARPVGTLVDAT